jgi:hypothetical protein
MSVSRTQTAGQIWIWLINAVSYELLGLIPACLSKPYSSYKPICRLYGTLMLNIQTKRIETG